TARPRQGTVKPGGTSSPAGPEAANGGQRASHAAAPAARGHWRGRPLATVVGGGSEPAQDVAYLVQGLLHLGFEITAGHQVESLGVEVSLADRDRSAPRDRCHDLIEQPVDRVAVVAAAEASRLETTPELVEAGEFAVGAFGPAHGRSIPRLGWAAHRRGRAGYPPRTHTRRRGPRAGHRRRAGNGRWAAEAGAWRLRCARRGWWRWTARVTQAHLAGHIRGEPVRPTARHAGTGRLAGVEAAVGRLVVTVIARVPVRRRRGRPGRRGHG